MPKTTADSMVADGYAEPATEPTQTAKDKPKPRRARRKPLTVKAVTDGAELERG